MSAWLTMMASALLSALAGVAPATAQSALESMELASNLGTILASEEACGLTYRQEAIETFIDDRVSPENIGFPSELQSSTWIAGLQVSDMSDSALTAHCRAVSSSARHFGFIE